MHAGEAIDALLAAFMTDPPLIHAGGPYSDRAGGARNDFERFIPLGAEGGPGVQPGELHLEAPDHPAVAHLPVPWTIADELYSFRTNPRGSVRVLLIAMLQRNLPA